jgi:PRC-barrel domain
MNSDNLRGQFDDRSAVGGTGMGGPPGMGGSAATHAMGENRDGMGRDRTDAVTAGETNTLISADKVEGTAVYDATGERLGTIDSIMINKRSGKVAYAVMSFGGFLGIGERYHPLPWDTLTYDTDKGGYNIRQSPDELRSAPNYSRDELDRLDYGQSGNAIRSYYGVPY